MPIPIAAAALDTTSWMFAVEGTAFNAYLLHHAFRFREDKSNGNARDVFKASLWHLPAVLALFVFHSRRWVTENIEDESISTLIERTRARLRGVCIHEIIQKEEAASFCPVVVVEEAGTEAQRIAVGAAAHKGESPAGP